MKQVLLDLSMNTNEGVIRLLLQIISIAILSLVVRLTPPVAGTSNLLSSELCSDKHA